MCKLNVLNQNIKQFSNQRSSGVNWRVKARDFKRKLLSKEGACELQENTKLIWKNMTKNVEIVAKAILGEP